MKGSTSFRYGIWLVLVGALLWAGCASMRLQRETFEGSRLAVIAAIPPEPIVYHQLLAATGVYPHDPRGREATGRAREVQERVERLQGLLQAAAERVDVAARMAHGMGRVSTDELGMVLVDSPDQADYILDVRVYNVGLAMHSSRSDAVFRIDAEVVLRAAATDDELWSERIGWDEMRAWASIPRLRLTPAERSRLSEDEMVAILDEFAHVVRDHMVRELRADIVGG